MKIDLTGRPALQLTHPSPAASQDAAANTHKNSGGHFRIIEKDQDLEEEGRGIFNHLRETVGPAK